MRALHPESAAPKERHPIAATSPLNLGYVLVLDVVGYSRSTTERQREIFQEVTGILKDCSRLQEALRKKEAVENMTGDGYVVCFFDSFLTPVEVAEHLLRAFGDRSFLVRMAIHVGVVSASRELKDGEAVVGEGVNLAVRALQWAVPSELVLTSRAYDLIRESNSYAARLRPLGKFPIKHGQSLVLYAFRPREDPLAKAQDETMRRFQPLAVRLTDAARKRGNTEPANLSRIVERLTEIRRESVIGLIVLVLAIGVHLRFEDSRWFREANLNGYQSLQTFLRAPADRPPVTVIDIGDALDDANRATDLGKLKTLLTDLASYHPRAIAVDIDMGPDENEQQRDSDRSVRQLALDLSTGAEKQYGRVPVFLAVNRWIAMEKNDVFGDAKYAGLIASPHIPASTHTGEILLARSVHISDGYPTLAGALASQYPGAVKHLSSWLVTDSVKMKDLTVTLQATTKDSGANPTPELVDEVFGGTFPVNYSGLQKIVNECTIRLTRTDPSLLGKEQAHDLVPGSMVVVGSDTRRITPPVPPKEADLWELPNRELLPGMYYHALGAWTLALAPLYVFNAPALVLLSVLSGLLIFALPLWLKLRRVSDSSYREPSEVLIVVGALLATAAFSVFCMRFFSVMYTGYIAAMVMVLLHPGGERLLHAAWRRFLVWRESRKALNLVGKASA